MLLSKIKVLKHLNPPPFVHFISRTLLTELPFSWPREVRCPSRGNWHTQREAHTQQTTTTTTTRSGTPKAGTMISSNTRTTRSRYSSPAQSQNTKWNGVLDASKGATEGSRAFMQRWLEPTVQSKASFEDDGLVRYGVVENMAPLGSLPKPKKTGPETNSGVKRI